MFFQNIGNLMRVQNFRSELIIECAFTIFLVLKVHEVFTLSLVSSLTRHKPMLDVIKINKKPQAMTQLKRFRDARPNAEC